MDYTQGILERLKDHRGDINEIFERLTALEVPKKEKTLEKAAREAGLNV